MVYTRNTSNTSRSTRRSLSASPIDLITNSSDSTEQSVDQPILQETNSSMSITATPSSIHVRSPKPFHGNPNNVKQFIMSLKIYFKATQCNDTLQQACMAATFLEGDALVWFDAHGDELNSFSEFRKALSSRFLPVECTQIARRQLMNLKQGTNTVQQYLSIFRKYSQSGEFCQCECCDLTLRLLFIENLNRYIKSALVAQLASLEDVTFSTVSSLAIIIDSNISSYTNNSKYQVSNNNYNNGNNYTANNNNYTANNNNNGRYQVANSNNNNGQKFSKLSSIERQNRVDNKLCMYCGDSNHQRENCPKRNPKNY